MGEAIKHATETTREGKVFQVGLIEGGELDRFWPHVDEMLEAVPQTWGHFTKDEIRYAVFAGIYQLWGVGTPGTATFVFMTTVTRWPSKSVLQVVWGAGSFDLEMKELLLATMQKYAVIQECHEIEVHGRCGWEKVFADIGFKKTRIVLSLPVDNMRMN